MNTTISIMNICDLSDEMLLIIFKKLPNIDVLYSVVGVNQKLDRIACDINFTQVIDLMTVSSSDSKTNSIFDRFCIQILPRIRSNVECLTVRASDLEPVLSMNYPNLRKLNLHNLQLNAAVDIFTEKSPLIEVYQNQISDLTVKIDDEIWNKSIQKLVGQIYVRIFALLPNLKSLELALNERLPLSCSLLKRLPPTACSSNLTHLRVRMHNFDDCLCLLDGRLSQLHTLIMHISYLCHTAIVIENTTTLRQLKSFSLQVERETLSFDALAAPLLRRMETLESLTLFFRTRRRTSFIDGTYLTNDILNHMKRLRTFTFDIINDQTMINEHSKPSSDDIKRTYSPCGYDVDC